MGTTVTTNLGLIKPDGDEYIKEALPTFAGWAAQQALNADKIDSLFRHTTHTYTPVWTTDTGPNPVLGAAGTIVGKWVRLFPRMVFGTIKLFTGGAGFTTGTGMYRLSLPPVAVPTEFATFNDSIPVGKAYLHDADAALSSTVFVVLWEVSSNNFFFRRDSGDAWRSTAPITMAQNDRLSMYFLYPTATP